MLSFLKVLCADTAKCFYLTKKGARLGARRITRASLKIHREPSGRTSSSNCKCKAMILFCWLNNSHSLLVPEAYCINVIFWEKAGYQGFSFVRKRVRIKKTTHPKYIYYFLIFTTTRVLFPFHYRRYQGTNQPRTGFPSKIFLARVKLRAARLNSSWICRHDFVLNILTMISALTRILGTKRLGSTRQWR